MHLLSKFNKGFRFLCIIDIYSKYASVVHLKDKKGASFVNAFQKILKESNRMQSQSKGRKPNKIWADKGSEFYNIFFKKWLKDNDEGTNNKQIMRENLLLLKDLLEH